MKNIYQNAISSHEENNKKYSEYKNSHEYKSEVKYLERITQHFQQITTLFVLSAHSAYPNGGKEWFTLNLSDDQLLSTDAVKLLVLEGLINSAKREMRYMLEFHLKTLHVDQTHWGKDFATRQCLFKNDIQKMTVKSLLDSLTLIGFTEGNVSDFKAEINNIYSELCAYVHFSSKQSEEQIKLSQNNGRLMRPVAQDLRAFNRLVFRLYDILLCLQFNSCDATTVGDFIVYIIDDIERFSFSKGKYFKILSKYFDYKLERKDPTYLARRNSNV